VPKAVVEILGDGLFCEDFVFAKGSADTEGYIFIVMVY
jgi:hypothetical protein